VRSSPSRSNERVPHTVTGPVQAPHERHAAAREAWLSALAVGGLVLAHWWAMHGSLTNPWGDYGAWLHAVERYAGGETPYVDYYWMYPPLSMWLFGGVARVLGPGLGVIWGVSGLVYAAIFVTWWWYCRQWTRPPWRIPVLVAGCLLAMGLANILSVPLPLGMYSPAMPLAGLLLLVAATSATAALVEGSQAAAVALGACAALGLFAKQDAWLPMAAVLVAVGYALWVGRGPRFVVPLAAGFLLVLAVETAALVHQVGWHRISWAFWTPGLTRVVGRGGFSWERGVMHLEALSLWGVVLSLAVEVAVPGRGRRTLAVCGLVALTLALIHIAMEGSVREFADRLDWFAIPPELPLMVLVMVVALPALRPDGRWPALAALLLLSTAARARRQFEMVDWYHPLLELPLYTAVLQGLWSRPARPPRRALSLVVAVMVVLGVWSYWTLARGPLTRRGPIADPVSVAVRGRTLTVPRQTAATLGWLRQTLDSADPSGRRPLLASGQTAAFNYWVARPSLASPMLGFRFSHVPPDSIVDRALRRHARPFLLDVRIVERLSEPTGGLWHNSWELPRGPSSLATDRPFFERLLVGCSRLSQLGGAQPRYVLYDCP